MTKLKPISGKVRQSLPNFLNAKLVLESFFKNGFEATLRSKKNFSSVWILHFSFFANFWVMKLKSIFGKARECFGNFFYKIFFIRGFFREWFSAFIWSFWSFSLQYFRINQMFWMLIFQSSTGADLIIYFIL